MVRQRAGRTEKEEDSVVGAVLWALELELVVALAVAPTLAVETAEDF